VSPIQLIKFKTSFPVTPLNYYLHCMRHWHWHKLISVSDPNRGRNDGRLAKVSLPFRLDLQIRNVKTPFLADTSGLMPLV